MDDHPPDSPMKIIGLVMGAIVFCEICFPMGEQTCLSHITAM